MNKPHKRSADKAADSIQQRLTSYACGLTYDDLPPEAVHTAKARVIDNLGAVIGGFFGEPLRIARNLAAQMPDTSGATIIGMRMKTTPDMAAFVNASPAHYVEMQDFYGAQNARGHPSDTVTPVLAAAEHAQVGGRELITGIVLAYEVFCRLCDVFNSPAFDYTNFVCLGSALGAGKVLGLSSDQLAHCSSMAIVSNVSLRQLKGEYTSMWKEMASGQAGRAGVFAALLARAGMEGPHLPFEGKAGWCEHAARERFSLGTFGGRGTPFKILDTQIKIRPVNAHAIAAVLAAEKIAPLKDIEEVREVIIEVYKWDETAGIGERVQNPDSPGTANHSRPYLVAVTLMDGALTARSFDDAHLWNAKLRALLLKTKVVEDESLTRAYQRSPREHRARVTVVTNSGQRLVGEAGGDEHDLGRPKSVGQIEAKFRGLTEDILGSSRVSAILGRLWQLEQIENVAEIPAAFVLD